MKKSLIVSPAPDLKKSLDFYRRLNFFEFESEGRQYVADKEYIIELDSSKHARAGLKFFKKDWLDTVRQLRTLTEVIRIDNGYLLADFTGMWIYLVESMEGVGIPVVLEKQSGLGSIAGLSLEGISIAQMNKIWKILGFEKTMGDETAGWMSIKNDDGFTISLMGANACPHLFFNPSLTYFNGTDNLDVIQNIRTLNIPFTEEITAFNKDGIVDNVIIRDPGGLGYFIFSD
ncbi:hypothetical protein [Portibacter lacus]|uniref:Uncharacterized protein n=1 Tax=Portibacter lacus TaxID=1099794 RepID=A0AA37SPJ8_9BACT|nr:hypothetical protein [Portibacter lacus]GLR18271.1 hypothetical protein GCM10007940_28870 [Portibacter lacus]